MKIMKQIVGVVFVLVSAHALAEPKVTVQLSASDVKVGSVVTGQVWLSDFPQTQGGSLTVSFPTKMLKVERVIVDGGTWNIHSDPGVVDAEKGLINDLAFASFPGPAGDVLAATIEFTVVGKGKGNVILAPSELNPFAAGGELIEVSYESTPLRSRTNKGKKTAK